MRESYLNYSMSVIYSRALPDVRDGLKPSQRRILVAMNDLNLGPRAKHRKCAKICGDTSGNYHPHGESVVYPTSGRSGAAVHHALPAGGQPGQLRRDRRQPPCGHALHRGAHELAGGPHPRGPRQGDGRSRQSNYDDTRNEPQYLPAKFPNLLCNGSTGIAVGMATSLPPHNLCEVAAACEAAAQRPRRRRRRAPRRCCPGPDFPTGGTIMGRSGIRAAYMSGRSTIQVRAKYVVEEKRNRKLIVFTEIPVPGQGQHDPRPHRVPRQDRPDRHDLRRQRREQRPRRPAAGRRAQARCR